MTNLTMPKNYVEIDSEEMTYISGGYWFNQKESSVAYAIDVAIALASFGMAVSWTLSKVVAKMGWTWVKSKVTSAIISVGLTTSIAASACNLLTTVLDFTIGKGVADILDRTDSSGNNGYIQYS